MILCDTGRSEEHTSELQSPCNLVCRLLLEKKKKTRALYQPQTRSLCRIAHSPSGLRARRVAGHRLPALLCTVALSPFLLIWFFFFNDTATTEIYTLSLHDALPICETHIGGNHGAERKLHNIARHQSGRDRKSTRLNSSHLVISYAVFCLKKKK